MKVCVVQPKYSADYTLSEEYFQWEMDAFDELDESVDIAVFPESCDVPCYASSREEMLISNAKYKAPLIEKAKETAKRCQCVIFINVHDTDTDEWGLRNRTLGINQKGEIFAKYDKQHLTPGEVSKSKLDSDYTFEHKEPYIVEYEGIRYGFLTCYDFYFYESFAHIARKRPDIIIGCSHQRTDSHDALTTMTKFLAYNTNTYVLRASVSMSETEPIGGCSMVVAPDGKVLENMYGKVGFAYAEIDPHKKYLKPAGFGGALKSHFEYIEDGRRPYKYRPAGSAVVKNEKRMPYPRTCAHRGFNTIAPENSMPAFGAAVALGAEEIEFDLWPTADGEIVSIHDLDLERLTNGTGCVTEKTYAELLEYDFGIKTAPEFAGLKIIKFEEILKKFAGLVIMNIHIKMEKWFENWEIWPAKIIELIRKYDCEQYVYFMSSTEVLQKCKELAPEIVCCQGAGKDPYDIVDRAIEHGFEKVQLFKPYFNKEMIDKAHAHGILCNVFWSDNPEETKEFLDMGVDTILTNDYHRISQVVDAWKEEQKSKL